MSIKAKLSQVKANPFRDMSKYPIDRRKVDGLKESMKQTGFWENIIARPEGNVIANVPEEQLVSYLSGLTAAYNEDGPLFNIELGYGHHRWVALQEMGIEEIEIPIKAITDDKMLQIMANENKGDWSSNMSVILETVRQTRQYIQDQITPYATGEDYLAAMGDSAIFTKEQFVQAKEQGIGFRTVRKFLGETWAETDIRHAVAVLRDIDEGRYEQEQVIAFPSVGVLGAFSKVAENVLAQPWPTYFQRKMIDDISTMIADPAVSTTVKILKSAQSAVSDGKDPVRVIKNPGIKRQEFSVVQAIKDMVYENMDKDAPKLSDIPEMEGFKDFPELDKVLEEVQKSINRSEAAKKSAETAAAAGEATGEGETTGEGMDQAQLDAAIADAEATAGVEAGGAAAAPLGDLPPILDESGAEISEVDAIASRFCDVSSVMANLVDTLVAKMGELDSKSPAFDAGEILFKKLAVFVSETYSPADCLSICSEVVGAATEEAE